MVGFSLWDVVGSAVVLVFGNLIVLVMLVTVFFVAVVQKLVLNATGDNFEGELFAYLPLVIHLTLQASKFLFASSVACIFVAALPLLLCRCNNYSGVFCLVSLSCYQTIVGRYLFCLFWSVKCFLFRCHCYCRYDGILGDWIAYLEVLRSPILFLPSFPLKRLGHF